jgi:hypothetical protein
MTGVKPKKKSNATLFALLFLFYFLPSYNFASVWPVSDTIIIDGEIIYIEKREVYVNMDSLSEIGRNDVIKKQVKGQPWSVAIVGGVNMSVSTFATSVSDYKPFNNFTEDDVSFRSNLAGGIEISRNIWNFPALNGNVTLSAHLGASLNQVRIACNSFDQKLFEQDSLIALRFDGEEVWLDYFDRFDELFGELDTLPIPIIQNTLEYSTLDIPVRLRMSYQPNKSKWSFFLEAGVTKRLVLDKRDLDYDNFLVNEKGEFVVITPEDFIPQDLLRPVFALGTEYDLEKKSDSASSWFSIGAAINASFPSAAANSGSLFYVNLSTISPFAFLRFHF